MHLCLKFFIFTDEPNVAEKVLSHKTHPRFPLQDVMETSSETRSKLQAQSENLRVDLDRWRSAAAADVAAHCDALGAAADKNKEDIKAAMHRERKYFKVSQMHYTLVIKNWSRG